MPAKAFQDGWWAVWPNSWENKLLKLPGMKQTLGRNVVGSFWGLDEVADQVTNGRTEILLRERNGSQKL